MKHKLAAGLFCCFTALALPAPAAASAVYIANYSFASHSGVMNFITGTITLEDDGILNQAWSSG